MGMMQCEGQFSQSLQSPENGITTIRVNVVWFPEVSLLTSRSETVFGIRVQQKTVTMAYYPVSEAPTCFEKRS